jgi:hypothetical protein
MPVTAVQTRYRFRSDTTTVDAAPTWAAAENVTYNPGINNKFRLRFEVQNTGNTSTGAQNWNLFYSRNAGAYSQISISSSFVQSAAASVDADNTALTVRRLTVDAGTFVNGQYDSTGATGTIALTGTSVSEFEFGLVLSGNYVSGDTVDFRIYRGVSTALNTYTQTPRINITVTVLGASPITVGSPILGAPSLPQAYNLATGDLTALSPNLPAVPAFTAFVPTGYNINASSLAVASPNLASAPPFSVSGAGGGINLGTPPAFADSSPYYTTPDFGIVTGSVSVTASSMAVSSPVLGNPVVSRYALTSAGFVDGSPSLVLPTFSAFGGPVTLTGGSFVDGSPYSTTPDFSIGIGANDLNVTSPIFGVPTFSQRQAFSSTVFAVASPSLGAPTIKQAQVISPSSMAIGSPLFGVPAIAITPAIVAAPLAVGSLSIGVPTLTQIQVLSGTGIIVASPVIGSPTAAVKVLLTATNMTLGSPPLGSPTLSQMHLLSPLSLATGSPQFSAAVMTFSGQVTAVPLTVGSPIIGVPIIAQKQVIAAASLAVASPTISAAAASSLYTFAASPLMTSSPTFGIPSINQNYHFLTTLTVGSPVLATPPISQYQRLVATALATLSPVMGVPSTVATLSFTSVGLTIASPIIGAANLNQQLALTAVNITTASLFFGPAAVALVGQIVAVPVPVLNGSPVFGTPTILQSQVLSALPLVIGSPQFTGPIIGNVAASSNLTVASPVLGAPSLVMLTGFPLAQDISVGSPVIGMPSIVSQLHVLSAGDFTISRPFIDVPGIIGQLQFLTAAGLTVASPVFGPTVAVGQGQVGAVPLITGSPVIGAAAVGQIQHVTAWNGELATGRPYLEPPILTQLNKLNGVDFITSAAQCGIPSCGEIINDYLTAQNLTVVSPDIAPLVPDLVTDDNRLLADYFVGNQAAPDTLTGQAFNTDTII